MAEFISSDNNAILNQFLKLRKILIDRDKYFIHLQDTKIQIKHKNNKDIILIILEGYFNAIMRNEVAISVNTDCQIKPA